MKQAAIAESQAELVYDQLLPEVEAMRFAAGQAAAFSVRCPGRESASEDCAALIPFDESSGVLAVADGLGGLPAGEYASRVAIEMLQESLQKAEGTSLRAAILDGIEAANQSILDLGLGAATTLAVIEIQGDGEGGHTARPYHIGDSMILIVGQRGRIKFKSVDHSPTGYAVEAGFLDENAAIHHEDRHLVCNMLGSPDMHITIGSPVKLAPRDTVVIASDGVADNLHLDEIVEQTRKGAINLSARRLAEASLARMGHTAAGQPSKPDDLTAIVYRPTGAGGDGSL